MKYIKPTNLNKIKYEALYLTCSGCGEKFTKVLDINFVGWCTFSCPLCKEELAYNLKETIQK